MKAPDYGQKKNQKKMNANTWKKNGDQDDKISFAYSFLCSRQRLLILKISGMNFDWIDSHTHYENQKRYEIDYWIKVRTSIIFEIFFWAIWLIQSLRLFLF